jgi:hypothetical protein
VGDLPFRSYKIHILPAFVRFDTQKKGRYIGDDNYYIRAVDVSFVTDVSFDNSCCQ